MKRVQVFGNKKIIKVWEFFVIDLTFKAYSPSISFEDIEQEHKHTRAIQELPVQSAICHPVDGATFTDDDEITLKGYAYSGGGKDIIRVDVTPDGGKTWTTAQLKKDVQQEYNKSWAWTLWEKTITVPKEHDGKMRVCVKAIDSSYNTQPDNPEAIWNVRGLLMNAWHCIQLNIEKQKLEDE